MQKILSIMSIFKIPLTIILTFVVQILIANNFELFGVTPNIILVTIVIISMWNRTEMNVMVALIMGILTDLIFHFSLGQSIISYLVIALCISYMSKKYRKDSKAAIVYITIMATCIFAGFGVVYYVIDNSFVVNIFALIKQVVVEILLNISLAYILYKVFEKNMKEEELNTFYTRRWWYGKKAKTDIWRQRLYNK